MSYKREITTLRTPKLGDVLLLEVGATCGEALVRLGFP